MAVTRRRTAHTHSGRGRQLGELRADALSGAAATIVHQPVELGAKAARGPVIAARDRARVAAPEKLDHRLLCRRAHVAILTSSRRPQVQDPAPGRRAATVEAAGLPLSRFHGQSGAAWLRKGYSDRLGVIPGCSAACPPACAPSRGACRRRAMIHGRQRRDSRNRPQDGGMEDVGDTPSTYPRLPPLVTFGSRPP